MNFFVTETNKFEPEKAIVGGSQFFSNSAIHTKHFATELVTQMKGQMTARILIQMILQIKAQITSQTNEQVPTQMKA
jgi:hypothetical protein